MLLSAIYSIWEGTWLELNITVILGLQRSVNGVGRLLETKDWICSVWRSKFVRTN
jgi:hypothetical protein